MHSFLSLLSSNLLQGYLGCFPHIRDGIITPVLGETQNMQVNIYTTSLLIKNNLKLFNNTPIFEPNIWTEKH